MTDTPDVPTIQTAVVPRARPRKRFTSEVARIATMQRSYKAIILRVLRENVSPLTRNAILSAIPTGTAGVNLAVFDAALAELLTSGRVTISPRKGARYVAKT